jgi:hypothetical protein
MQNNTETPQRIVFENMLFVVLYRSAGIGNRRDLQQALAKAGYDHDNPEWLRRQLHVNDSLLDEFVDILKSVAPDLSDQDWIDIFWARYFPEKRSPTVR